MVVVVVVVVVLAETLCGQQGSAVDWEVAVGSQDVSAICDISTGSAAQQNYPKP